MNNLFSLLVGLLSFNAFAMPGQMIAKDYWLKNRVPEVAAELCEGKIVFCMGIKREACGDMFLTAAKTCGDKLFPSMPDYFSSKDETKKFKMEIRECAWPATREQVGRQIRANPKANYRQCMEFMVPNAPTPKEEEWNGSDPVKPKAVK
jgi:hypothetical protein